VVQLHALFLEQIRVVAALKQRRSRTARSHSAELDVMAAVHHFISSSAVPLARAAQGALPPPQTAVSFFEE
jgi:hypothetical protein